MIILVSWPRLSGLLCWQESSLWWPLWLLIILCGHTCSTTESLPKLPPPPWYVRFLCVLLSLHVSVCVFWCNIFEQSMGSKINPFIYLFFTVLSYFFYWSLLFGFIWCYRRCKHHSWERTLPCPCWTASPPSPPRHHLEIKRLIPPCHCHCWPLALASTIRTGIMRIHCYSHVVI